MFVTENCLEPLHAQQVKLATLQTGMQCGESLYGLLLFSPPKTFSWDGELFETFRIIWLQTLLGGGGFLALGVFSHYFKGPTIGPEVSTAERFLEVQAPKTEQGGLSFDVHLPPDGFQLKGNWIIFIISSELITWGSRMCHISRAMSRTLQTCVLGAETCVTERNSLFTHYPYRHRLATVMAAMFSQRASISYPFLFSSLCAPVIFHPPLSPFLSLISFNLPHRDRARAPASAHFERCRRPKNVHGKHTRAVFIINQLYGPLMEVISVKFMPRDLSVFS